MTKWKQRKVSGLWAGLRFCAGCVGFRAWSLRIDSKMVSPFAGCSHVLADYSSLGLSQFAMQTCKLLLILVYVETWFRLSLSKSKSWPRWLISLFYSRKPKELKDILSPKLLIFVSEKSLPLRKAICYLESGGINFLQLDIKNKLNPLTSLRSRKQ